MLCVCATSSGFAQDLESIGETKPISISGGVSLNQIFYHANGLESRRDPYTYYASGNVNFSLYGWSVPISFSYSNQNFSYQQPFNQYGLHPTYKWITGHFGYTSMSFSPYTLNGHIFLGAGIDAAPEGKWKFSGLYGRFLKAVEPDSLSENASTPAFQRMGYGFKATYSAARGSVEVTIFHGEDDPNSISYIPEEEGILPEENLVLGIAGSASITQQLIVRGEFASSAITRDLRAEGTENSHVFARTKVFDNRLSSAFYNAYKTSLNYQFQSYAVGVGYERIDPGYRTHGAYYFNNDLENITANGAASLVQGKVNLAANVGTQRDNLDNTKISEMKRLVGAFNVGFAPTQKLNLSASYSSFQTFTNIRSQFVDINQVSQYDNLDTLNFTQISQNATLTGMYMFGKDASRRQTVNVNLSFQDAADKQADVEQNSGVQFYNFNAAYGLSLVPQNTMLSVSFNATLNQSPTVQSKTLGPVASVSKSFFEKKLRATLSSSYNNSYTGSVRVSSIVNGRLMTSVTMQKKHNVNLSVVMVNRDTHIEGASRSFTEFTGTLGYSYSFGR
jgi:hypothetical protein